ncbi:MAG: radical SAM protein, partial [Candidatus Micrarchaeaceae archaeon]
NTLIIRGIELATERLIGLANTAIKSNFVKLDKPYKLNFCVTYLCQSRCETCNIWQIKPKGELTIDEVREFAKKNTYFKWVELTGGEPFLRGDIVEIAKAFKENSKELYILTMPTNSLCNQDMVERKLREILALGIPRIAITVSLDGYRELHDKIRGIPGNYDKAIAMFKRLKALKKEYSNLFFVFGYTLSKFNKGEFEKTYEAVKSEIPDIRHNDFHINLAQVSTNYYGNGSDDIKANNAEVVGELESILKHREFQIGIIPIIETAFTRKLVKYAKTGTSPMITLHGQLRECLSVDNVGHKDREHKGHLVRPASALAQRPGKERKGGDKGGPRAEPVDIVRGLPDAYREYNQPAHLTLFIICPIISYGA